MKAYLLLLITLSSIFSCSKLSKQEITIGKVENIYSDILKENRSIWVYVPKSNSFLGNERYPVVYLLDGDAHFSSVVGLNEFLSGSNGNTLCPKMIIVAIVNTDRTRDLTPSHDISSPMVDDDFIKTSGGGEAFTSFLEKELIPHINSNYPVTSTKILMGHSFGGLFAVNTLIYHPDLFDSYIAIDPSMWWDDQKLLNSFASVLNGKDFSKKSFFLAVAKSTEMVTDTIAVKQDTSKATLHFRSNLKFAEILKKINKGNLHWNWKYYNDENHTSVPLVAAIDAFKFLYNPTNNEAVENIVLDKDSTKGLETNMSK